MSSTPPTAIQNGFQRALSSFQARLTSSERAQFKVATLDDLKVTILAIQAEQRSRKEMMHMGRLGSFLEAMEQFGKVIEVFLNTTNMLAYVWGPMKMLLLTASCYSESFNALLDAYHLIAENLPIFQVYQDTFAGNERMQVVLESIWSNILNFHVQALRIFSQSMLRQFFRSLWKDFDSRFKHLLNDLKRQKEVVESHANQIHIQNYESDRLKIFEEFEHAQARRAEERYMFVMQWISAAAVILDHEDHCAVRQEEYNATNHWTSRWILSNEEIEAWLAPQVPKSSMLWINGIPGAGKSVLASVIIEEIQQKELAPVAFFYCKHQNADKNKFISIIRAVLSQFVAQQRHVVPFYHDEGIASGELPLQSMKLCKKLLRYMLQNIPKGFLIIDGIDECDVNERKSLLDFLNEIIHLCDSTNPGKIRILILSREEPDIKKYLSIGTVVRLDSQDTLQDIELYVRHRARLVQRKFGLNAEDQEYIEQNVLDRTQGMFLYAKLVMQNLEDQPSLHHLHKELEPDCFPSGLDEAYHRTIDRIQTNSGENEQRVARRILSLMLCSRRPFRWREVQAAISINTVDRVVDSTRRLPMHIRDICGSLIEVLPGDRIEFVHVTASFYIMDSGYIMRFLAEHFMTLLCLNYLTFECFEEEGDVDMRSGFANDGSFAFQDYAVAHWTDHLLALLESPNDTSRNQQIDERETSGAFIIFADRFAADLVDISVGGTSFLDSDQFRSLTCFPIISALWRHAKTSKALVDNRCDEVNLPSLGRILKQNRKALEDLAKNRGETATLTYFYGPHWFKCSRLSCYFFHEGFNSESSRQDHYDRHDRPFRCDQEDCPGAAIGFGSLKELDKHKRNMHPGADKLSSTFARLKKGKNSKEAWAKYPCPRCTEKFRTRFDCRVHMSSHQAILMPKGL
ncbi:NACHT domain containing protein [Hyaloscypha variabilis]